MSQMDPKEWRESIIASLKSDNLQMQATAIGSAINFLNDSSISNLEKKDIISQLYPMIEIEFSRQNSGVHTDCINLLLKIGLRDLSIIKPLFPQIIQDLKLKNRLITKEIIDFLVNMGNSNDPLIQQAFSDIINNTSEWFSKPFLIPIIDCFYSSLLEQNYHFIHNNYALLKEKISHFPSYMKEIQQKITKKIEEFEIMMKEENEKAIKKQKDEDEKKKLKEEKRLEEQRKNLEIIKKNQEVQFQPRPVNEVEHDVFSEKKEYDTTNNQSKGSLLEGLRRIEPNKENGLNKELLKIPENKDDEFRKFGLSKKLTPEESDNELNFSKMGLKKKN